MLNRLLNRKQVREAESIEVKESLAEVDARSRENHQHPERARERELLRLRQLAGQGLARDAGNRRQLIDPGPDAAALNGSVPEISGDELTAGLIRATILEHGSILVRGLVPHDAASRLAEGIDAAFEAREAIKGDTTPEEGYYEELEPVPGQEPILIRKAVELGGGVLAADSPRVAFEMFELLAQANIREVVAEYLGEVPLMSAEKTTLRRAEPTVPGAWHQDGKFLGDVNSLNLWLSLSRCGDVAPGLDLVPRRLEHLVDAGIGAEGFSTIVVTQEAAEELAGERGIVRPIFEPGDAIFFDHLFLHQTASDPAMPSPRFAVESWFFGPSAFPSDYTPLAA